MTVTLKGWKWSDGMQITARDIQFWQNLVTANKDVLAGVHPGRVPRQRDRHQGQPVQPAPDHVQPQSRVRVVLLHLQRVEPDHPAPATHLGPGVGDRGGRRLRRDPRGRQAVYAFLDKQSRSVTTYDTNPLWEVVSGPWRLNSIDTSGKVTMVPNPEYGGPVKPTLKEFDEVPFTQDTTEFNELKDATSVRDAKVDFGYIPPDQAPQASALNGVYRFEPWNSWSDQRRRRRTSPTRPAGRSSPAVLPPGDAGPGRPEHLHHQGVLRVRDTRRTVRCRPSPPRHSSTHSSAATPIRTTRPRRCRCSRTTDGRSDQAG